jgi:hypothetical protein
MSGDTVVVGARSEDSAARGVNGKQADNTAAQSGAAYVFVRTGSTWKQEAYLKASNTAAHDHFAETVSISDDRLVTGAHGQDSRASNSGAAYVFVRQDSSWRQQAYLEASNTETEDQFGVSASISGDTVVVGAHYEDSAARGVNGDQTDNSAMNAGAAYVFVLGPLADFTTFGHGCKGSKTGVPALSKRRLPILGKSFLLDLANAPLNTAGLLFFGFAPWSLDLGLIGAPGCTVHARPDISASIATDGFGKWPNPTPIPVPNDAKLVGAVFYNQFLLLDLGANQLGLIVSNGGKATIGY